LGPVKPGGKKPRGKNGKGLKTVKNGKTGSGNRETEPYYVKGFTGVSVTLTFKPTDRYRAVRSVVGTGPARLTGYGG